MGEPLPGFEKGRYKDQSQRRLYPIATFNSACAKPVSFTFASLGFTPNQVSLLSLFVSIWGFVRMADGEWLHLVQGGLLVHLGLILDHADGQVARRKGKGSIWGMYLDMVIDRVVEVGLIVSIAIASLEGLSKSPDVLPVPWEPLGHDWFLIVCAATIGVMMLWRFLTTYNDLLYLRTHILKTQRAPGPTVVTKSLVRRPLIPWVFNRDWILLIWLVGVILGQLQGTVLLLLILHALVCIEKMIVFAVRHKDPEGDASRIMGKDYH